MSEKEEIHFVPMDSMIEAIRQLTSFQERQLADLYRMNTVTISPAQSVKNFHAAVRVNEIRHGRKLTWEELLEVRRRTRKPAAVIPSEASKL